jgi:hypothetical protein
MASQNKHCSKYYRAAGGTGFAQFGGTNSIMRRPLNHKTLRERVLLACIPR